MRKFAFILIPLSLIYGIIIWFRNLFFDLGIFSSKEFQLPIISVGNITVGGTGKTPHIEYLISFLKKEFNIATLSRGYKRKAKGFILANDKSTAIDIGDEPMQLKRKFPDIKVAVDKKRVHGVEQLLKSPNGENLDVVLLDDAYQHRAIKPGLSILLIDYNRPITEDSMLPYGNLRESSDEKDRANIIIVSKTPVDMNPIERRIIINNLDLMPFQNLYFTSLKYEKIIPVFPDQAIEFVNQEWTKQSLEIMLVTGIASPKLLKDYLVEFSDKISEIQYPDHYSFTKKDLLHIDTKFAKIESEHKLIITTEKDAVRFMEMELSEQVRKHIFYVPLTIQFLNDDTINFQNKISNYVRKNKRSSNLYKSI